MRSVGTKMGTVFSGDFGHAAIRRQGAAGSADPVEQAPRRAAFGISGRRAEVVAAAVKQGDNARQTEFFHGAVFAKVRTPGRAAELRQRFQPLRLGGSF